MTTAKHSSSWGMWAAVWAGVFVPQLVLLIQHWRSLVLALPRVGAGLLEAVAAMAAVALVAVTVAGLVITVRERRSARIQA